MINELAAIVRIKAQQRERQVLFELGHIPSTGEVVEHGGVRFTVVEVERNRVRKVRVERKGLQPA